MDDNQPYLPQGTTDPESVPAPGPPKDKFPVGLIVIIIYTGFGMVGCLAQVVNPVLMIGTTLITGVPAFLYAVVQLAAYVTLFVWLIQRKERGRILGIILHSYNIAMGSINFGMALLDTDGFIETYQQMVPTMPASIDPRFILAIAGVGFFIISIIGLAVILYLVFKKAHFTV